MTVYDEKRKVLKELFEKHIRVKCKAKERSGALISATYQSLNI